MSTWAPCTQVHRKASRCPFVQMFHANVCANLPVRGITTCHTTPVFISRTPRGLALTPWRRYVRLKPYVVYLFLTTLRLPTFTARGFQCNSVKQYGTACTCICCGSGDVLLRRNSYNLVTNCWFICAPLFLPSVLTPRDLAVLRVPKNRCNGYTLLVFLFQCTKYPLFVQLCL